LPGHFTATVRVTDENDTAVIDWVDSSQSEGTVVADLEQLSICGRARPLALPGANGGRSAAGYAATSVGSHGPAFVSNSGERKSPPKVIE
jgi:hypothetical protein